MKGDSMAIVSFRQDELTEMTPEREARLKALEEMPDSEIDCSDIPEVTDFSGWMTVEEAKAYRAARKKQAATV
jgi:hypothetical protein